MSAAAKTATKAANVPTAAARIGYKARIKTSCVSKNRTALFLVEQNLLQTAAPIAVFMVTSRHIVASQTSQTTAIAFKEVVRTVTTLILRSQADQAVMMEPMLQSLSSSYF